MKTAIRTLLKTKSAFNRAFLWPILALPATSHATNIESVLNKGAMYLTGGIAKAVGVIVIMGLGYLCLIQHKFPKEQFAMALLGIGIIFGGGQLYATLVG
jgi:type IV secretion system protein VirB2